MQKYEVMPMSIQSSIFDVPGWRVIVGLRVLDRLFGPQPYPSFRGIERQRLERNDDGLSRLQACSRQRCQSAAGGLTRDNPLSFVPPLQAAVIDT